MLKFLLAATLLHAYFNAAEASSVSAKVAVPISCGQSSGKATLSPDAPECVFRGAIRGGELQSFSFDVLPGGVHDVVVEMKAIKGDAML
mmetsp:Transcript_33304/g.73653  ORF Transcript_33304/g.73653 Transcript_33304/m.73653 type:complete len:89 (+) Transcript_33304:74-340(+)